MTTKQERDFIKQVLLPDIRQRFDLWAKEYQQERDLGKLGTFANLYRKVRKLKSLIWPGENRYHGQEWREDERTIATEIVADGLLYLVDLAKASGEFAAWEKDRDEEDEDEEEVLPPRVAPWRYTVSKPHKSMVSDEQHPAHILTKCDKYERQQAKKKEELGGKG